MQSTQNRFREQFVRQKEDNPRLVRFKQENRLEEVIAGGKDEISQLVLLNEWTFQQFGDFDRPSYKTEDALVILEKIKEDHTFYCAQYVSVFVTAAFALGWEARPVSLKWSHYAGRDSNHNVTEVWVKSLGKWVMFDPTLRHYVSDGNTLLNCYEIGREWFNHQGNNLVLKYGEEGKDVTKADFPIVVLHFRDKSKLYLDNEAMDKYACLAFLPTNCFLGEFPEKSMERWDHWKGVEVVMAQESGWKDDCNSLAPYYSV